MIRVSGSKLDERDRLSLREECALEAYGAGLNRHQIAGQLRTSARAVTTCLTLAKEKLGANSLAQAAVMLSDVHREAKRILASRL